MNPLAEFFASSVDFSTGLAAESAHDVANEQSIAPGSKLNSSQTQKSSHRVCDRCIGKKVKCDMKQPSCSRCSEVDSPCIYSVKKRKPGPIKGSKHSKRKTSESNHDPVHRSSSSSPQSARNSTRNSTRGSDVSVQQMRSWAFEQPASQNGMSTVSPMIPIPEVQANQIFISHLNSPVLPQTIPSPLGIPPNQDQQRSLIESFFTHIHPSIPLFHRERFLSRYEAGLLCQHLLLTICVVTAKTLGLGNSWDGSSLDDCIAYLLDLKVVENESAGKRLSLDYFRQACLLAFYAFHQYPGEKAWMRIGTLTRKAYQCGLHQIDFSGHGSGFNREKISTEDLEEWRYVWWCIYCLDCYSNVTAVTPFIVERESIKTALVSIPLAGPPSDLSVKMPPKYLPDDTDDLWRTAKDVTSSTGAVNFNMHILTTTMIREASTLHRLCKQSTSKRLKVRLAELEGHFCTFRLALPGRYLNPSRNVIDNESSSEHHARLICVLHIHLARILTYFPTNSHENLDSWTGRWQQCLECCEDIVTVAKQWDGQYFTATDPAICFIILFALTLVHLHGCSEKAKLEFKVRMETYKDVLVLFLEQFASAWSLPRFLIISFEQFQKIVTSPLSPLDTDRVLRVSFGPINYRWLNFLSLSKNFEGLDSPGRMYEDMFSQEWDLNDWEALIPTSQA